MKTRYLILGILLLSLCIGADSSNPINCIGEKLGCKTDELEAYEEFEAVFTTASKEVIPIMGPLASLGNNSVRSFAVNWNLGSPIFELYQVLKDGDPLSYFNIHDCVETVDRYFEDIYNNGQVLDASIAVDAPFDVGFNGNATLTTYNIFCDTQGDGKRGVTYARVDENEIIYILNTSFYYSVENTTGTKNVTQGWYNQTTGDIEIGLLNANYVVVDSSTDSSGWELVRAFVSGNTETHMFELKIIRNGVGYDHNITGYGKSQGASNYFLIKMANDTMNFGSANYYLITAEATIVELQAMDDAGSATVPAGDTSNYDVELNLIDNFTEDDLPTASEIDALDIFSF